MAHEIKNPLTPIQLSAERIAKKFASERAVAPVAAGTLFSTSEPTDIVKEGTDTILREVQGLKAMVDEFSRFARLPDVRLEPGSVTTVIEQVIAMYGNRFDHISIASSLGAGLPEAMIDAEQLKRVFVNLIENSIESLDGLTGERSIHISTRHDVARDLIVAEVSDSGRGIDPSDFERLFQPYFSTKGRGTGLGLAIVHRIVAEHHGKIIAATNHPRGAKFIIEIPAIGLPS
jgi:nitrogen fixation/metabolism regulation signal transduction histidine kinase